MDLNNILFRCNICGEHKKYDLFKKVRYPKKCLECIIKIRKEYDKNRYNPEKDKLYREKNKEIIKKRKNRYYLENKEEIDTKNKNYNNLHKAKLKEYQNIWIKDKRDNDPAFKLRNNFSKMIGYYLIKNNSNKNRNSILKYLPYTPDDLKLYIENQFESWMTWDNYGKYNYKTWNDDDSSTWVWNIDHIIPQSSLPYTSMEDENFKKCWALENLRPYSAKQNLLDGDRK
jgi:hypothetical protein